MTLPYNPEGWYTLAFSRELKPGQILNRTLAETEVVVFRTEGGQVAVFDAHCPHLGAHLGHGGRIQGETIQCPFHHFRFNTEGTCVATGYGTKAPPKAIARSWDVVEANGLIRVYYGAPERKFHIPVIEDEGWTSLHGVTYTLPSHVQEPAENSVDIGHLAIIHKFRDVEELVPMHTHGPHLSASYRIAHPIIPERFYAKAQFTINVYGLGYSRVDVEALKPHFFARVYANGLPIAPNKIELRLGLSIKVPEKSELPRALRWLPIKPLLELAGALGVHGYAMDVKQDFPIWKNKIYVDRPPLAKGDGPIPQYRKWARQFYPDNQASVRAKLVG